MAGVEAPTIGELTTIAAPLDGNRIEINARTTRGGSVETELLEKEKAIDGFTFAANVPFRGDEVWAPLEWRGKRDLSALRGRRLALRLRLASAKVFGFRFA